MSKPLSRESESLAKYIQMNENRYQDRRGPEARGKVHDLWTMERKGIDGMNERDLEETSGGMRDDERAGICLSLAAQKDPPIKCGKARRWGRRPLILFRTCSLSHLQKPESFGRSAFQRRLYNCKYREVAAVYLSKHNGVCGPFQPAVVESCLK